MNGLQGRYNTNSLGGFGRNAAANAIDMQSSSEGAKKLANSNIQVSRGPEASPYHARNDYLAYASEELKHFDISGDRKLDQFELTQAFNGNETKAKKFMSVVNQDGKEGSSVVDLSAHLYLQDGVADLAKGANSDVDKIIKNAQTANQGALKLDGTVTVAESKAASDIIEQKSDVAAKMLKSLQSQLKLEERYKEFKAQGGENYSPALPTPNPGPGPAPGYVHPYFPPTNDYAVAPPANEYQAVNNTPPVNAYAPVNNYTAVDQTQQVSYPPAQNQSYALNDGFQQQIMQLFQALISMLTQFIPQMAYAGVQR